MTAIPSVSLVGRAGFEPATNGLKVLCAHGAPGSVRGEFGLHGSPDVPFSPICGQKVPHQRLQTNGVLDTITVANGRSFGTMTAEPSSSCSYPFSGDRERPRNCKALRAFAFPPSGREVAKHTDLHGSHPRNTGPDHQSDAPTRTWQGCRVKIHACKGDKQRRSRVELPHRGTWSMQHRSRLIDGER